jgi:hypothetical protein
MRPPKYYLVKARLSGLHSRFIAGLVMAILGVGVMIVARGNITPASVFVRAYTRSDGTSVSAYSRRPRGAAQRHRPYETAYTLGLGLLVGGLYLGFRPLRLFLKARPEVLLPPLLDVPTLPEPPLRPVNPTVSARARRPWKCHRCGEQMSSEMSYFFPKPRRKQRSRTRYCQQCAQKLVTEAKQFPDRLREYEAEHLRVSAIIAALRHQQFRAVYGCDEVTKSV